MLPSHKLFLVYRIAARAGSGAGANVSPRTKFLGAPPKFGSRVPPRSHPAPQECSGPANSKAPQSPQASQRQTNVQRAAVLRIAVAGKTQDAQQAFQPHPPAQTTGHLRSQSAQPDSAPNPWPRARQAAESGSAQTPNKRHKARSRQPEPRTQD